MSECLKCQRSTLLALLARANTISRSYRENKQKKVEDNEWMFKVGMKYLVFVTHHSNIFDYNSYRKQLELPAGALAIYAFLSS